MAAGTHKLGLAVGMVIGFVEADIRIVAAVKNIVAVGQLKWGIVDFDM